MKPKRINFKLEEKKDLGEDLRLLTFKSSKKIKFEPGQYASIIFEYKGKKTIRQYSLASSPEEKFIKFFVKKVKKGPGSNFLFHLRKGDKIEALIPLGKFKIEKSSKKKDLIFIGNGTGMAPFLSMVPSLLNKDFKKKLTLITGFKKNRNIPENKLLNSLQKKHANFKHFSILSREKSQLKGHIQDNIKKLVPKEFKGDFYLCGLKIMIEEVKNILMKKGFKEKQIFLERYD